MEIKDYSEITSKIEKANAMIDYSEKAKCKEIENVIGNIKSKMEAWLNNTCGVVEKMIPTSYKNNVECSKSVTIAYGNGRTDYLDVHCHFRSWYSLEITITERCRCDWGKRFGLCYVIDETDSKNGFKSFNHEGISVSYDCDETTMQHITTVWPKIKSIIEEHMDTIMEKAKEKIVNNAASIKSTLEILESMKDFEA